MALVDQSSNTIDGTPEKHIFRGMIADYDLQTGLCELIDNALDLWTETGRAKNFKIEVALEVSRQIITVKDNAGGVKQGDLRLLIAPGASRSAATESLIGIFGVGGKRAGVALGEHVEIRSRFGNAKTFKIIIDNDWLQDESWEIAYASCASIEEGSTIVEVSKLRQPFDSADVDRIKLHLGETYGWFIDQGCEIEINSEKVESKPFNVWSYPPDYPPRQLNFTIRPDGSRDLRVRMEAGLIADRDPEGENYGVYVYCNNRLIVKEMRERDVGYYISAEAGVPHPDASLCRVIVTLDGHAELMPWNSSKSNVNIAHPSFMQLRANVISLVTYYTKLSRRLKHDWDDEVFSFSSGAIQNIDPIGIAEGNKLILPKLPRTRRISYLDTIRQMNAKKMNAIPQTVGLVEAMGMVNILSKQKLETKNRASLILLDSNFEIALKEFIVSNRQLFPTNVYNDAKLKHIFGQRTTVVNEVKGHVSALTPAIITKVEHYYGLRNKLIHERTTVPVSDREVIDYRKLIEKILKMLFGLKFPDS